MRPLSSSESGWPVAPTPRRFRMSDPRNSGVKTLGIKVPDALHAQFALVAQLDGISLGDAALRAVELYVSTKKAEPGFAARAQAALEEIEREAAALRSQLSQRSLVTGRLPLPGFRHGRKRVAMSEAKTEESEAPPVQRRTNPCDDHGHDHKRDGDPEC